MVGAGSRSSEVHYEVCAGWRRRGKDGDGDMRRNNLSSGTLSQYGELGWLKWCY